MKTSILLLTSRLVAGAMAETTETQSPQATEAPAQASFNETRIWGCGQPQNAVYRWYYNSLANGPNYCAKYGDAYEWAMLNAYRSGGQENVHWKYTNDENDAACLMEWKYYRSDGRGLIATVHRTTTLNDSRRWCALPVYRSGGQQAKQWAYCNCF